MAAQPTLQDMYTGMMHVVPLQKLMYEDELQTTATHRQGWPRSHSKSAPSLGTILGILLAQITAAQDSFAVLLT